MIVGNWKMHGRAGDLDQIEAIRRALRDQPPRDGVFVCPPAILLREASRIAAGSPLQIGAQDCSPEPDGPFTGDHSAGMLAEAGARLVIVGHSERRSGHGETDALVRAKASAVLGAGIQPLICIGETAADREAGRALEVVAAQACASIPAGNGCVLAYEPVWAIGANCTPSAAEIAAMHAHIRNELARRGCTQARVLYGGSVRPENAAALLAAPGVDGLLVGGASLAAEQFLQIVAVSDAQARRPA